MLFCNGFVNFPDQLLSIIRKQQEKDVPSFLKEFSVFDPIPRLKYSGGRVTKELRDNFDFDVIKKFNAQGVNVFAVMSNLVYDNLEDPLFLKTLTELSAYPGNGVIIAQEKLRDFIRKEFPCLKLSKSVCGKNLQTLESILEYQKKYDYLCCRQNTYEKFYDSLDTEKFEILLNNACPWNCPYQKQHYTLVSQAIIDYIDGKKEFKQLNALNFMCFYHHETCVFDLKKILDLGYTTLKFSLRAYPLGEQISCVETFLRKLNSLSLPAK